jgi:hypothetical protein
LFQAVVVPSGFRTGDVTRVLADLAAEALTLMGGSPEKMAAHQRGLI